MPFALSALYSASPDTPGRRANTKFALESVNSKPSFASPAAVKARFSSIVRQLASVYAGSLSAPTPAARVTELTLYGLTENRSVFRSRMTGSAAKPRPRRAPAIDRDFENVCVTSRLSYRSISFTTLSPPKSTYASSTTTIRPGSACSSASITSRGRAIPVGALGLAMTSVPCAAINASISIVRSSLSGTSRYGTPFSRANTG